MGDSGHWQILPSTDNRGPSSKEKFFTYIRERQMALGNGWRKGPLV